MKDPTHRAGHTLDLVVTDLQPRSVKILHAIWDHNMILGSFDVAVPETIAVTRQVLDYRKADWSSIKSDWAMSDWTFIDQATVDDAERFLNDSLFIILRRHIPERLLIDASRSIRGSTGGVYRQLKTEMQPQEFPRRPPLQQPAAVCCSTSIYYTCHGCGTNCGKNNDGARVGGELQTKSWRNNTTRCPSLPLRMLHLLGYEILWGKRIC